MNLRETTVKREYKFRGRIINVRVDDALLPDGKPCFREVVEHHGGASILYVRDGKVLLVRQFRYPYGEETLEIPAGKLNEGEDPAQTAARELEEETGFVPARVEHLFTVYPTPGYSDEKIYIYAAEGVREGHVHLDEGEFLTGGFYPLDEAAAMIRDGRIRDAKTIIAVQNYLLTHRN